MTPTSFYFAPLAAAFVRGKLAQNPPYRHEYGRLLHDPLGDLSTVDLEQLIALGLAAGLRLHKFKRTMDLARVRRVLGVLKGLSPANLLDVGSGRGTFLWPLLDLFPSLPVTAIDRDEQRVADIGAVRAGGIEALEARWMDATALTFDDASFDVVTMLEVLEHIPAAQQALSNAVRVARRAVVLSVPSRADDNPQHIHLFDQNALAGMCARASAARVRFDYVPGHLIAVVTVTCR